MVSGIALTTEIYCRQISSGRDELIPRLQFSGFIFSVSPPPPHHHPEMPLQHGQLSPKYSHEIPNISRMGAGYRDAICKLQRDQCQVTALDTAFAHLSVLKKVWYQKGTCALQWRHDERNGAMSAMASQINGIPIVCSTVCSGADQRKL